MRQVGKCSWVDSMVLMAIYGHPMSLKGTVLVPGFYYPDFGLEAFQSQNSGNKKKLTVLRVSVFSLSMAKLCYFFPNKSELNRWSAVK